MGQVCGEMAKKKTWSEKLIANKDLPKVSGYVMKLSTML
jgi:hypothetical protein